MKQLHISYNLNHLNPSQRHKNKISLIINLTILFSLLFFSTGSIPHKAIAPFRGATETASRNIDASQNATNLFGALKAQTFSETSNIPNVWSGLAHNGLEANSVFALASIGTDLYVGGGFKQTSDGAIPLSYIAKYDTLTDTWSPLANNGLDNQVTAMIAVGSDLYIAGYFFKTQDGAISNLYHIAKYNTITNTWASLPHNGLNGIIQAFSKTGNDLYIGGQFSQTSDGAITGLNNIAKFNLTTGIWSPLANGGISAPGSGKISAQVMALATNGQQLYVGGLSLSETFDESVQNLNYVAKYDIATNTWSQLANGGLNSGVYSLILNGNHLYVGGQFYQTFDGSIDLRYIAKYDTQTNIWEPLANNGLNNTVRSMTVQGNELYIGGFFNQSYDGQVVDLNRIAKYNFLSTSWSALANKGLDAPPFSYAAVGNELFIGGYNFRSTYDGIVANLHTIAKYSIDNVSPINYTISGTVTINNMPVPGVLISDNFGHTSTTDANGHYILSDLSNGNYIITPSQGSSNVQNFSPSSKNVTIADGNVTNVNFTVNRTPVLIIPGIAGTFVKGTNEQDYKDWLTHRGVDPSTLAIDPLAHVYDDLIQTLENVGYIQDDDVFSVNNANLFVVKYDWRLPPAPVPTDGMFDGHISGLSAPSISDDNFSYGVDYLGYYLKRAAEQYQQEHPGQTLDKVDLIVHSTGGLIARAYIQSDAYGALYDGVHHLPTINNLIMVGVPNRGAAKAWNPLHDDWKDDFFAYQVVLSKILNNAFVKLNNEPDPKKFIKSYVPSIGSLLSTYDFIDTGTGMTDINQSNSPYVDYRNNLLLDLNNGYDTANAGDPNGFTSSALVNKVTIIYGNSQETQIGIKVLEAPALEPDPISHILYSPAHFAPFDSFDEEIIPEGSPWYVNTYGYGDGTVPNISAIGQFANCGCATIQGFAGLSHTGLMSDENVQKYILDTLGVSYSENKISSQWAPWIKGLNNVVSAISDPVEFILTDGTGKRFGYTTSTGSLTEIPNSIWYGGADGIGWIFGPVQEPLSVQLKGLNESYYVMVSGNLGDKKGGIILSGEMLESGSTITEPIVLTETTPPTTQSIARLDSSPSSASNVGFKVTFSENVTGIDISDFNLTTTGVIGASIKGISGTGSTRSISVNTGTGTGTIRLDVSPTATIFDLVGNPMTELPFTSSETYTINDIATFADVEMNYWAWQYIERLYNSGITGGCSTNPLSYCPTSPVTRAQMAVFLLKGIHGSSFAPPAVVGSTGFTDVDVTHWAAAWIKQLAAESITGGCGSGIYCPENTVTRAQMAVFLLKAMHGSSYFPPNVSATFGDTSGHWAEDWIEQLAAEGITSGCAAGLYCPENPVTRDQMAVFLVKAFNLP